MHRDEFPSYLVAVAIVLVSFFIILKAPFTYSATYGPNYAYVGVDTRVNITESFPSVGAVIIDNGASNITLSAGLVRSVVCNVTAIDYNGWNDVIQANATFWDNNNANMADPDNNNTHYTNTSCVNVGNDGEYQSYWECGFNVWYYANNGSNWVCNATVIDSYYATNQNYTGSGYNITTIGTLYALNVTQLIDYGDMAVGDTSTTSEIANITNFGNMQINISVYGWGGKNITDARGNGLAFICEQGNITIDNERYSYQDIAWSSMTTLTNESSLVPNLMMQKRTTTEIINTTYWRLYIPPNPFGLCNGTVVFAAEAP